MPCPLKWSEKPLEGGDVWCSGVSFAKVQGEEHSKKKEGSLGTEFGEAGVQRRPVQMEHPYGDSGRR